MIATKSLAFRFADMTVREREFSIIKPGQVQSVEPKAFRVLLVLLRNPQNLITKEELLTAVWADAAVTENSLTRAITLLRRLLDDSAREPRFIETVTTIGYRWLCPVEVSEDAERSLVETAGENIQASNGCKVHPFETSDSMLQGAANGAGRTPPATEPATALAKEPATAAIPTTVPAVSHPRGRWLLLAGVGTVVLSAVGAVLWYARLPLAPPHVTQIKQLTQDVHWKRKLLLGLGGDRLYLKLEPPTLAYMSIDGGEITPFSLEIPGAKPAIADSLASDISPDGKAILATGARINGEFEMWIADLSGTSVRFLTRAYDSGWTPDGRQVIYMTGEGDIRTIPSSGGASSLVLKSSGSLQRNPVMSPDGTRIRFSENGKLMEVSANGGNLHEVLQGSNLVASASGGWTSNGDLFVFEARLPKGSTQLWALDERHVGIHKARSEPVQLTFGPTAWGLGAISPDGETIYASGENRQGELVRFNNRSGTFERFLDGISVDPPEFSPDGSYVAYLSYPDGTLWRANRDGRDRIELLKPGPGEIITDFRWAPDGKHIGVSEISDGLDSISLIDVDGGSPIRILPQIKESQSGISWSPDGKKIVYWMRAADQTSMGDIRVADLVTHQVISPPHQPLRCTRPQWSPDGRYILCEEDWFKEGDFGYELFDTKSEKWTVLHQPSAPASTNWAQNGRSVYFLRRFEADPGVFRMSIPDGRTERVIDLKDFRMAGWAMGLDPTDAPILMRDAGNFEVYALKLER